MSPFKAITKSGKWSVRLNAIFASAVCVSLILVLGMKVLSFGDRWWDITVPALIVASITALVMGIRGLRSGDRSVSVAVSVGLSILTILFVFLHSLFISD